mgnify:CR=1 FL=1
MRTKEEWIISSDKHVSQYCMIVNLSNKFSLCLRWKFRKDCQWMIGKINMSAYWEGWNFMFFGNLEVKLEDFRLKSLSNQIYFILESTASSFHMCFKLATYYFLKCHISFMNPQIQNQSQLVSTKFGCCWICKGVTQRNH